jgi:hypothetical protein
VKRDRDDSGGQQRERDAAIVAVRYPTRAHPPPKDAPRPSAICTTFRGWCNQNAKRAYFLRRRQAEGSGSPTHRRSGSSTCTLTASPGIISREVPPAQRHRQKKPSIAPSFYVGFRSHPTPTFGASAPSRVLLLVRSSRQQRQRPLPPLPLDGLVRDLNGHARRDGIELVVAERHPDEPRDVH